MDLKRDLDTQIFVFIGFVWNFTKRCNKLYELQTYPTTARIVKLADKKAYVVLNAVPPRASNMLADASDAVAVHGLEVAPVALRQRAAYSHALTAGRTAQEYEPKGQAAKEISSFYQWLKQTLQKVA